MEDETLGSIEASVNKPPSIELVSPYCIAMKEKGADKIDPANKEAFDLILQEIDSQSLENFNTFEPEGFPGTKLSYSRLEVTPDLVDRLGGKSEEISGNTTDDALDEESEIESKPKAAFLFTAIGQPPDGNAFMVQDMAIDRFTRYLPTVARAIREGHIPPKMEIYMMGSGTGEGESVTEEFVENMKKKGFDSYGGIYAKFIEEEMAKKDPATRILLQGVSMGTVTASSAYGHLSPEIQEKAQRLLDNPAGTHEPGIKGIFKGAQAAIGVAVEGFARSKFDSVGKTLNRKKPNLSNALESKNQADHDLLDLESDNPREILEQLAEGHDESLQDDKNKKQLFRALAGRLLKGAGLDTDKRGFIRQGLYDPLTTSPKKIYENYRRRSSDVTSYGGKAINLAVPMKDRGRILTAPMDRSHIFIYENFKRWNQIINYCKTK